MRKDWDLQPLGDIEGMGKGIPKPKLIATIPKLRDYEAYQFNAGFLNPSVIAERGVAVLKAAGGAAKGERVNVSYRFHGVYWAKMAPAVPPAESDYSFYGVPDFTIHEVWRPDDQRLKAERVGWRWDDDCASYIIALPWMRCWLECNRELEIQAG